MGRSLSAQAAIEAGAAGLGVVCVDEGEELRLAGIDAPILVLGYTSAAEAERIVDLRLTPVVASMQAALSLSRFAAARGVTQKVHLELESGLNRHGLPLEELVPFAESVRALPNIEVEGLFTHFAAAEEGDTAFTRSQFDALMDASARLPWIPVRHCSASASILNAPDMKLDMVRAGIAIYGYEPAPGIAGDLVLQEGAVAEEPDRADHRCRAGWHRRLRAHVDGRAAVEDRAGDVRLRRRIPARALEQGVGAGARPACADRRPHRDGYVHGRRDGRARRGGRRRGGADRRAGRRAHRCGRTRAAGGHDLVGDPGGDRGASAPGVRAARRKSWERRISIDVVASRPLASTLESG